MPHWHRGGAATTWRRHFLRTLHAGRSVYRAQAPASRQAPGAFGPPSGSTPVAHFSRCCCGVSPKACLRWRLVVRVLCGSGKRKPGREAGFRGKPSPESYGRPLLFFVASTKRYSWPDFGVGGSGSPRVIVRSLPVSPPRVPTMPYWPERGAGCPGLKVFAISTSYVAMKATTAVPGSRPAPHM